MPLLAPTEDIRDEPETPEVALPDGSLECPSEAPGDAESRLYRLLFESAPEAALVTDARGQITLANQAAGRLLGTPVRSLARRSLTSFIPSRARRGFRASLARLQSTAGRLEWTGPLCPGEDVAIEAELTVTAVGSKADDAVALYWVLRDVSERQRVQAALGEEARRFRSLTEMAPIGILQLDADRRCLVANARWQAISGLELKQSLGYGWSRALYPDDRKLVLRGWSEAMREGPEFSAEHRIITPRGEVRWVTTRIAALANPAGELTGYALTIGDITERQRAAEALHASECRFRALTERSWDAISMIAADGTILYDNPAASTRILGYQTGELVGHSAFDRLHPEDRPRVETVFADLVQQPGASVTEEFRYRHKDGSWRWIEAAGTNLLNEPHIEAIVCNYRDITERKRAEEEIQRRNRELATLNAITAAVSSSLEPPEVLATFRRLVSEELALPGGMIFLGEAEGEQLCLEDSWGLPAGLQTDLAAFPLTGADYDRVMRDRKAVLAHDLREVPRFSQIGLDIARPEWESFLCIPLLANDRVQGAVGLFSPAPLVFREDQLAFFEALGQEVGVAIQNAQLFKQVRDWREQLETLSRRLVELQERERQHIACELHDEVGQLLTGLRLTLEAGRRREPDRDVLTDDKALELVDELISRVRDMSLDLRPAMLDDLGLLPTLLWHFKRYTEQTGVRVTFEHEGLEKRFSPAIETAAYRIVQEALTNVARHAGVTEVAVSLRAQGEHLSMEVYDCGCGFKPQRTRKGEFTSGLSGMRERAVLLGGRLNVCSIPGRGTQLLALLPIDRDDGARKHT